MTTASYSPSVASSRLSSPCSRSPTPPSELCCSYPSPQSSQLSSLGSTPSPDDMKSSPPESVRDDDDPPPTKRRKLEPKRRVQENLDLTSIEPAEHQQEQLDRLLKTLNKKRKIVVVAGAGISVSAGIPDFRSSTGLFKTLKGQHNLKSSGKDLFDASVYKDDKSTSSFHDMVRSLSTATKAASPTPFHHMLATLANDGRLLRLYTQNVDGIDTSLPPLATEVPLARKGPWPRTVQLHGCLEKMVCTKCHRVSDLDPALFNGAVPPPCSNCVETDDVRTQHAGKRSHGVGRLRPRMVLYNEHNPDDEAIGSVVKADLRTRPDALIVVGTTLKVPGVKRIVKEMCGVVRDRRDGITIWINSDPPPLGKDFEWDLVVKGRCDDVASHANMRQWDTTDVYEEVTDEQLQKVKQESGEVQVIVMSPSKSNKFVDRAQGVLTPLPSPRLVPQTSKAATTKMKQSIAATTKKTKAVSKPQKGKKAAAKRKTTLPKQYIPGSNTIKLNFTVSKPGIRLMDNKAKPMSKGKKIEEPTQLQPVSPSAARNNSNPPFQPPRPVTPPQKSYAESRGVPLAVEIPSPRIGESPEDRSRIVTPPGEFKGDLKRILNL